MMMVTAANLVEVELSFAQRCDLLERATEVVTIEWFEKRIAACFDDAGEEAAFRKRYSAFTTPESADIVVCAVRRGNAAGEPIFWTEPGGAYRYPAALQRSGLIAFLADWVAHRAFFDVHPFIVSFHAAAVRVENKAVAISAMSTGGKSTTALACARRGMEIYTDERCVIIDGRVHAFPRAINLRKGGLELLLGDDVAGDAAIGQRLRSHDGADWESATFEELFGDLRPPEPAPLDAIFFIEGQARQSAIVPLPHESAITQLLTAGLCGPRPGMDRVAAATAIFQHVRVYGLTLGSPDDAAQLIARTTCAAQVPVAL